MSLSPEEASELIERRTLPKRVLAESNLNDRWLRKAFLLVEQGKDVAEDVMWEVPEFGGEW